MPARRPGKLPPETISATYALEYGQNALELHPDMVPHGARVLIHDDVLATGGTVEAIAEQLVERLGGVVVGCCFIIELGFLKGRERLSHLARPRTRRIFPQVGLQFGHGFASSALEFVSVRRNQMQEDMQARLRRVPAW